MPSGSKMRCRANWSNGIPSDLDRAQQDVEAELRLYAQRVPGWKSSGTFLRRGMTCATVSPSFRHHVGVAARAHAATHQTRGVRQKIRTVISRSAGTTRLGIAAVTDPDGAGATRPSVFSTTAESPCSSGMNFETGSVSRTLPSSTIIITATPTTGLVIDMMRKMASFCIGFLVSRSIRPCASKCAMRPLRATSDTAPANVLAAMCRCIKSPMRFKRSDEVRRLQAAR